MRAKEKKATKNQYKNEEIRSLKFGFLLLKKDKTCTESNKKIDRARQDMSTDRRMFVNFCVNLNEKGKEENCLISSISITLNKFY